MGTFLRGKSWYTQFWYDGTRYTKSFGQITKTLAKEKHWRYRNEVIEGKTFKKLSRELKRDPKSFWSLLSSHNLIKIDMRMISPCVYLLIKKREVGYVGQSINLLRRLSQHQENDFDEAYYLPVPVEDLIKTEKPLIQDFNPPLNKMHEIKRKEKELFLVKTRKEATDKGNL